jgi:hypothetical protein
MTHPYGEFEGTRLWATVDAAVAELVHNRDVQLTTARDYVIGYLCRALTLQGLVSPAAGEAPAA